MDGTGALLATLSVVMIPLIFAENNEDGLTRERCQQCRGKGFLKLTND